MALKLLFVFGGIALFMAMIWDRFTGRKSARIVLVLLSGLIAGVLIISHLVAFGFGPG